MGFNFAPYEPASFCIGSPQPGTIYLDLFLEEMFPDSYFGNIYACRDIVGGDALSHHAEGRADDRMTVRKKPADGISMGYRMVQLLGPHGKALGIDHIITNLAPWQSGRGRPMTYTARYPSGKVYTGLNPHKDHNHTGLIRSASKKLTLTYIRSVVLGTPPPQPEGGTALLPLKQGQKTEDVRMLKDRLNETFGLKLDISSSASGPLYDDATVAAVKQYLGPMTNHPEGKEGRWVVAQQWGELTVLWNKKRLGIA